MKRILIISSILLALIVALAGCSERAVDNRGHGMQIAIQFSSSVAAIEDWNYRVIITGDGMVPLLFPLTYLDGLLMGEFDVPAGSNRLITIEVFEFGLGGDVVIYRGSRLIDVVADEENLELVEVPIMLEPVPAMIRTSPVYRQTVPGGTFSVDVRLYNVPTVSQMSFQVHYDPLVVTPTSAVLHTGFPTANYALFSGTGVGYWSFSIFDTVQSNVAFTDAGGDAPLATIFFAVRASAPLQPTQISVDSAFMVNPQGTEFLPSPLFFDETTVDVISAPQSVIFGEPALENIVKDSLDLEFKDLVTIEAAGSLTALRARDKYLRDLTGLSAFTNLGLLNIGNNRISDISPIGSLTRLQWLAIDHNRITTITPLQTLTSLRTLHVSDNHVNDLSAMQSLISLTTLQAWHNSIVNLGPLSNLVNLDTLGLGYNNITDISALEGMTGLSWLNLEGNNISDIGPLIRNGGLQAGDVVTLRGNPVASDPSQIDQLGSRGVLVII